MIIRRLWWLFFGGHDWKYRNPWARECRKCGRHENYYGDALGPGGWDEIYPLADKPEKCACPGE